MTLVLAWLVSGLLAGGGAPVVAQATLPRYQITATLPSVVDGQPLGPLAFDPGTHRLFAGSPRGLYWADLTEPHPSFRGPTTRGYITRLEIAPDLGRLFYISLEEVGFVDTRTPGASTRLTRNNLQALDIAYEPSRHELYLSMNQPRIQIFDARSGRRGPSLNVPGWYGYELEAVPGRVFLLLAGQGGLYSVDAAERRVAPWIVKGRIVTPAMAEADPGGRYLFLRAEGRIFAIDAESGVLVGRSDRMIAGPAKFDPGTGLLLAQTVDPNSNLARITGFRAGPDGLTIATQMDLNGVGDVLETTRNGFIQVGAGHQLNVWSTGEDDPVTGASSASDRRAQWAPPSCGGFSGLSVPVGRLCRVAFPGSTALEKRPRC